MPSVHQRRPSSARLLHQRHQGAGGRHARGALVDHVVVVQKLGIEVRPGSAAPGDGVGQAGAEGQRQPLQHQVELPAKAPVYPEVEDAVEEAVGGREPHHHELHPLWDAAA